MDAAGRHGQTDRYTGRWHAKAYIRVARNAQILLNLLVFDPAVVLHVLLTDPPHLRVRIITAVCQTQLPLPDTSAPAPNRSSPAETSPAYCKAAPEC